MKKIYLLVLYFSLTACNINVSKADIIGTWEVDEVYNLKTESLEIDQDVWLTFEPDFTFTSHERISPDIAGKWELKGSKLIITQLEKILEPEIQKFTDSTIIWNVRIDTNQLRMTLIKVQPTANKK